MKRVARRTNGVQSDRDVAINVLKARPPARWRIRPRAFKATDPSHLAPRIPERALRDQTRRSRKLSGKARKLAGVLGKHGAIQVCC